MGLAGHTGSHTKDKDMHDNDHPIGSRLAAALFALLLSSTVLLSAIGPASAASSSPKHASANLSFRPVLA